MQHAPCASHPSRPAAHAPAAALCRVQLQHQRRGGGSDGGGHAAAPVLYDAGDDDDYYDSEDEYESSYCTDDEEDEGAYPFHGSSVDVNAFMSM